MCDHIGEKFIEWHDHNNDNTITICNKPGINTLLLFVCSDSAENNYMRQNYINFQYILLDLCGI